MAFEDSINQYVLDTIEVGVATSSRRREHAVRWRRTPRGGRWWLVGGSICRRRASGSRCPCLPIARIPKEDFCTGATARLNR